MAADDAEARILDGRSWSDFCDALKAAGEVVLREKSPDDAFDRAEGFRYLSRLTRVALESFIECADPAAPVFRRPAHETVKIGADNPDNYYESAAISDAHEYRITGTRGTVHYLGFGTYAGNYNKQGGRRGQIGYLEAADMKLEPDGSFEIFVTRERPADANWLPLEDDASLVIVRQTFQDRARETVAKLRIERLGAEGPPAPVTAAFVDQGLQAAAGYVHGTAALFADWAEGFAAHPNELPLFDPAVAAAAHGDPNIAYFHGYWELGPDEALVIEATPPRCDYWNFQLNNYWMESLDYRYHPIAVNHHGARLEPDGSVRIVVAHADPGVGNWIDTAGHARGTMCLRWIGADACPHPTTRVVPVAELQ
ncbi:MAG: DUF1214 domain-containing protein [Proteobacteria bacterium]|nr:DUF1214 domain-containing protein [Pseudomonadota bacterium]